MTECVCDYSPKEIQIFIDHYRQGLAKNVSIYKSHDGKIFLTIHKGGDCICMYELLDGKWVLIPPMNDF